MATFVGNAGTVHTAGNAIAEIRSFSINETMDTIESTSMGDSFRSFEPNLRSFDASIDVFFDDTDTNGQNTLTVGTSASFDFFMEGSASGKHRLTGTGLVTGRTINSSIDGMVEASLTIQGTGGLTETTAP